MNPTNTMNESNLQTFGLVHKKDGFQIQIKFRLFNLEKKLITF